MLVLARQRDESVIIGDHIEVTVVDVRGDKVRLGISAPKNVTVHRKEVYEAIRKENHAAARLMPHDLPFQAGPGLRHHPAEGVLVAPMAVAGSNGHEDHHKFLNAAIEEARKGAADGGLPIGSVLVRAARSSAAATTAGSRRRTRWLTRRSTASRRLADKRLPRHDPLLHADALLPVQRRGGPVWDPDCRRRRKWKLPRRPRLHASARRSRDRSSRPRMHQHDVRVRPPTPPSGTRTSVNPDPA